MERQPWTVFPWQRVALGAVAVLLGVAAYSIPFPGLSLAGRVTLGIFVTAAFLWITEAVPLFVTSFVIVMAEVIFLGLPYGPLGLTGTQYTRFLAPFFDPIIALFLGGFVLGIAMNHYQLDLLVARSILARVGAEPRWILAGFMGATAFLSMWLSNTATTALMMAVLLPVLRSVPDMDPFRKALVLGIPFAANVGGTATPVGTPPNAIAIGALARVGVHVSFLEWMVLAVPLTLVMLIITWLLLQWMFPSRAAGLHLELGRPMVMDVPRWIVVGTFAVTVALWLTTSVHGVPAGVVALIPVVVFFGLGVLETAALGEIGWDVLFIVAGGISLGVAMQDSGLSQWIVDQINLGQLSTLAAGAVLAATASLMSTFISNSATTILLVPIVIGFAGAEALPLTAAVALAAGLSMILPISTPPNAIAYGTGVVRTADMARAGAVITGISVVAVILFQALYWPALGYR